MTRNLLLPLTCITLLAMLVGCGEREPNWTDLVRDHLAQHDGAPYYSISSIDECAPDSAAPLQQERVEVRCRLRAVMNTDLNEVQAEHGSATDSEMVAELVQMFGRFRADEEHTASVRVTFRQDNGNWQAED